MKFNQLLANKEHIILDGGMGTMLQNSGLEIGGVPELLNITNPELLISIHKKYIDAGADVIYTNTFGANSYKMKDTGYSVEELISSAIENARKASEGTETLVALDVGPIGQLLEPTGTLSFEKAYDIFKQIVIAGKSADVIVFETMTDLLEIKAAVLAAKENTNLPIMCTMTFEKNMRTFTGCGVSNMALTLEGLGVTAIGVNCSLGPDELLPVVKEMAQWTTLPLIVKPNAGLPDPLTNEYNILPEEFSGYMCDMADIGVKIFGGCCGTTPDYISVLCEKLDGRKYVHRNVTVPTAVCSASETVLINQPRIIGERINPTGKKKFKEALINHDIDYILNQAIEQTHAGAEILDVNVGLPEIDEKSMMVDAVKAIQGITDAPLQLDSTIPEVLEAALRIYCGKPIVNSVNGEDESLDTILPLVKKYGAAVVGLTLDKDGIPKSADKRFDLAVKILNKAMEYGIPKENVFIDCLTLTASAEQDGVIETLNAVKRVKDELGLKTVLGVSNISFGLPNRERINHTFLALALENGLDLPIINPNISAMSGTVRAYRLLKSIDKNSKEYIEAYNNEQGNKENSASANQDNKNISLEYAIENGLKNDGARITKELLESKEPMEIVNKSLIPALDKAGDQFEKGTIFLPQLILSAEVAQAAFGVIKDYISSKSDESVSKGIIVIATVKGDIHDIGKNIVKVLLENYGYTVIDLGKDVDYQTVVDAVKKYDAKLVGLSALMTTTLVSMEKTIELIHKNNLDCKIMVGGAVLTPEYAIQIGADYYSKDAKESVDIAKEIFQ
ncbi:MAG: homocysteine S-methyltransferase family protein [Lachnospiraceae bacterium]|nr:homocysteine S-methyltransferase family protein [Lachnospiraceae bacterium]